jgi:ketosteroid isomerase-like protein
MRPVVQKMADNNEQRLVHVCELSTPSPSGSCVSHRVVAEEDGREQTAVWFREGYEPARAGQQLVLEHASGVLPRSLK